MECGKLKCKMQPNVNVCECVWRDVWRDVWCDVVTLLFLLLPFVIKYREMRMKMEMVTMMCYTEVMIELNQNLVLHCLVHFLTTNQFLHKLL